MSRYQEFCESLRVGQIKAAEEQLERQESRHALTQAVGDIVRRMCEYFQCPADRVRYLDSQANMVTGTLQGSVPPIRYDATSGRDCLDVEIGVGDEADKDLCPVRLRLEFVAPRHGGLEFHFGSTVFQLPDEERALFDRIADAIKEELRKGYMIGPRKVGL